jgi:hypothetical protein
MTRRGRSNPNSAAAHGFGPNHGGHMIRNQPRARGRWVKTPSLGAEVCQAEGCGAFLLPEFGKGLPDTCHRCGTAQVWETCTHGACEGIPDPAIMRRGGYDECGERAVASELGTRAPRCAEHLDKTEPQRLEDALRALPPGSVVRWPGNAWRTVDAMIEELVAGDPKDLDYYVVKGLVSDGTVLRLVTGEIVFYVKGAAS